MSISAADYDVYAGTKAILATKTELYVEDPATPDSFVRVGELKSTPQVSDGEKPTIEATNLSSEYIEYIDALSDPSSTDASFTCNFVPTDAGQAIVESAYAGMYAGDKLSFELRMPFYEGDGSTRAVAAFDATVKNHNITPSANSILEAEISLEYKSLVSRSWVA